jgi:phage FluMu protein Com
MEDSCKHCGETLKEAQFNKNNTLKSCPNCSKLNGEEHVYYSNPNSFGITDERSSSKHPEGPQSHCNACRSKNVPFAKQFLCHEVKVGSEE